MLFRVASTGLAVGPGVAQPDGRPVASLSPLGGGEYPEPFTRSHNLGGDGYLYWYVVDHRVPYLYWYLVDHRVPSFPLFACPHYTTWCKGSREDAQTLGVRSPSPSCTPAPVLLAVGITVGVVT